MKKICLLLLTSLSLTAVPLYALENPGLSKGQAVYVPAYSHIYSGQRALPFLLTVTLSIRNSDSNHEIKITSIDFFRAEGKLGKLELELPATLMPLGSMRAVVPGKDNVGGSGAHFIVKWTSEKLANPPIIESIMIGTQQQQGVSFTSRGRAIIPSN